MHRGMHLIAQQVCMWVGMVELLNCCVVACVLAPTPWWCMGGWVAPYPLQAVSTGQQQIIFLNRSSHANTKPVSLCVLWTRALTLSL